MINVRQYTSIHEKNQNLEENEDTGFFNLNLCVCAWTNVLMHGHVCLVFYRETVVREIWEEAGWP